MVPHWYHGYLLLTSERSSLAEAALRMDSEWTAPLLRRKELRNVLAPQYVRRSILWLDGAQQGMAAAQDLLSGREYEVASSEVLRLAALSGCSAYHREFVALASDLCAPLVTADAQVLLAFPEVTMALDACS
jgi:hypothetical protein